MAVVCEADVRPPGVYRLPPRGRDGLLRREGGALVRLLHHEGVPALVRAWPVAGAVRLRAESERRDAALYAIERMRFALALDHDLSAFHRAFRRHPLLGPAIRRRPWLRPLRRPEPFEALAWAITEQLIESERAAAIQRRIVRRWGRAHAGLWDAPEPAALAAAAPAELAACDLAPKRALALRRAAREVAAGRVDLREHEPAWRRLLAIPDIGPWTVECLAFHGQGRDDMLPAGDLAYVKLVGRLARLGRRATVEEVRAWFAPFAPFQALAGLYLLRDTYVLPERARPPRPRPAPAWGRSIAA
jgi:3-methyladenine DNA glycosylase/8-oxoguanine DNA glycosylase